MRIALFPPMPKESQEFTTLRSLVESGRATGIERLLLETHDGLWRTKRLLRHSNIENRVLYIIAVALAGVCAFLVTELRHVNASQQEGRRISISVTCNALSAVIDAGRGTINNTMEIQPPKFKRNLEALGLPPFEVRQKQAKITADLYANTIINKVVSATGLHGVVNKDGTLNCDRLVKTARAAPAK